MSSLQKSLISNKKQLSSQIKIDGAEGIKTKHVVSYCIYTISSFQELPSLY